MQNMYTMLTNENQYLDSYITKSSVKLMANSTNLIIFKDNLTRSVSEFTEDNYPKKEEEKEQITSTTEIQKDPIKIIFQDDKDIDGADNIQPQKQNIVNYIETINRLKNENNFKHDESIKLRKIIKDQSLLIKNLNKEIDHLYLSSLTKESNKK